MAKKKKYKILLLMNKSQIPQWDTALIFTRMSTVKIQGYENLGKLMNGGKLMPSIWEGGSIY
jgi:hypothetical protein